MAFLKTESLQIFKIKEFRLFVMARFFLTLAVQMQFSTIYLQVYYEHSKEELMLGMIGLTEAIPFVITSFFSGHVSDNFNRKRIILFGIFSLLIGATLLYLNAETISFYVLQLYFYSGLYALFWRLHYSHT